MVLVCDNCSVTRDVPVVNLYAGTKKYSLREESGWRYLVRRPWEGLDLFTSCLPISAGSGYLSTLLCPECVLVWKTTEVL